MSSQPQQQAIVWELVDTPVDREMSLAEFVRENMAVCEEQVEDICKSLLDGIYERYIQFKNLALKKLIKAIMVDIIVDNIQISPMLDPGCSMVVDYIEEEAERHAETLQNCKEIQQKLRELNIKL